MVDPETPQVAISSKRSTKTAQGDVVTVEMKMVVSTRDAPEWLNHMTRMLAKHVRGAPAASAETTGKGDADVG